MLAYFHSLLKLNTPDFHLNSREYSTKAIAIEGATPFFYKNISFLGWDRTFLFVSGSQPQMFLKSVLNLFSFRGCLIMFLSTFRGCSQQRLKCIALWDQSWLYINESNHLFAKFKCEIVLLYRDFSVVISNSILKFIEINAPFLDSVWGVFLACS